MSEKTIYDVTFRQLLESTLAVAIRNDCPIVTGWRVHPDGTVDYIAPEEFGPCSNEPAPEVDGDEPPRFSSIDACCHGAAQTVARIAKLKGDR